ncbi:ABC transporter ATP-binding protein [Hylemonella gracilis]|uniref:ABC transporter n=1 Tax=Hylemonella gracilis ATCC 19624 TaxID=887062 RepID=F3KUY8_9BURK|nr:ABC transporter ATP-binding protein [Hylemonella gracilis]EGI76412.1 ABC transporter [Hylemonella gracilis ATCC 19624]
MNAAPPVLRLSGIHKRFGALVANDGISLELKAGEVLALLGENGAGKSTLVSILFGHYVADEGHVEVFGQRLPPGKPQAALAAGIGMVHQHFTLADNLSVLDNVMLGTEPLWQLYTRRSAARQKLLATAERFGLTVDPEARVGTLSVGERQRVEILKALVRGARILILDEPTAVLTPQESEALFATLGQMVTQGLSLVFISHKLGEVLRVSHRVAVLRAGRLVAEAPTRETTQAQLASWMVGHDVAVARRRPAARSAGAAVCVLDRVFSQDGLRDVSLNLRAGEIVAVAGVSGNGQAALADLLCGVSQVDRGSVTLRGLPLRPEPAWLVRQGVARIPEDRHAAGVVGDLPLWENAVSERLRTPFFSWKALVVRRSAARAHARRLVQAFDVRGGGLDAPARALSGGNMQKLILGRALLVPDERAPRLSAVLPQGEAAPSGGNEPRAAGSAGAPILIVAHQPTWGLDIGAVAYVHDQLIAARDAGAAVLLISDDLDEVLTLGDRVAVMHAGRLSAARQAEDWTREAIGLAMAGVSESEERVAA